MRKRFVKDPYLPSASGQNKTLKSHQNNVVINSSWWMRLLLTPNRSIASFSEIRCWLKDSSTSCTNLTGSLLWILSLILWMILEWEPPQKQSKLISQPVEPSQPLETLWVLSYLGLYLTGIEESKSLSKEVLEGSRLVSHEDRAEFSLSIQSLSLASRLLSHPDSSSFPPFSSASTASDNRDVAASRASHGPGNGSSSTPDFSFCTTCCSPPFWVSGMPWNRPSDDYPPSDQGETLCHSNDISSLPP